MIVFSSEIGLMKCAGDGKGASMSVSSWSCSCDLVRGRWLGISHRRRENLKSIDIGYRMCKFQGYSVSTIACMVDYAKVTAVRPDRKCERGLVLSRNNESVFVECRCCVGLLVVVCGTTGGGVAGQSEGARRAVSRVFLVNNAGVNIVGIDDSITKNE